MNLLKQVPKLVFQLLVLRALVEFTDKMTPGPQNI